LLHVIDAACRPDGAGYQRYFGSIGQFAAGVVRSALNTSSELMAMADPRQTHVESTAEADALAHVEKMSVLDLIELKKALDDQWGPIPAQSQPDLGLQPEAAATLQTLRDSGAALRSVLDDLTSRMEQDALRRLESEGRTRARAGVLDVISRRIEHLAVQAELESRAAPAALPEEIAEIVARDRSRQMQQAMVSGALGGGALLVGFGFVPGLLGAAAGALLGYYCERRTRARSSNVAA
jgi:hypothetical protein